MKVEGTFEELTELATLVRCAAELSEVGQQIVFENLDSTLSDLYNTDYGVVSKWVEAIAYAEADAGEREFDESAD
jgi:hypothetical protein